MGLKENFGNIQWNTLNVGHMERKFSEILNEIHLLLDTWKKNCKYLMNYTHYLTHGKENFKNIQRNTLTVWHMGGKGDCNATSIEGNAVALRGDNMADQLAAELADLASRFTPGGGCLSHFGRLLSWERALMCKGKWFSFGCIRSEVLNLVECTKPHKFQSEAPADNFPGGGQIWIYI